MGRAFGLISMVVSLALVAVLWAMSMQSNGPTSASTKKARHDATAAVSAINFTAAGPELEAFRAEHGTYAGAALPPAFGVTLMRADAMSYCLQSRVGASVQHFTGPSGTAAAGPC
jgi:Tfp pilus assembly protein PilE